MRTLGLLVTAVLLSVVALGLFVNAQLPKYREAFVFAFAPYEFTRSIQEFLAQQEAANGSEMNADGAPPFNQLAHNSELVDHTQRAVTTPNNDTLYSSAVLELSASPVELILPKTDGRYLSIAMMDVFTDQFAHIGPRETAGVAQTYWIVGPHDRSEAPAGVTVIRSPGNDVWLLARTFVSGIGDLDAARNLQRGISVRSVFPDMSTKAHETLATDLKDAGNFLKVVNESLARNPDHRHTLRAQKYQALGIGVDGNPGVINRLFWSLITPRAEAMMNAQIEEAVTAQIGWAVPPANLGRYEEDDQTRAAIAFVGFGALRQEDAIYYMQRKTAAGEPLDGSKVYQLPLPPDVPTDAFWSLSLYEPDETGRLYFYENATGRHSLNSGAEDLNVLDDGSVIIQMGGDAPADSAVTWMPTPDGPFVASFRLYLPKTDVLRTGWTPPAISER